MNQNLGKNIKSLRAKLGLNQRELAALIHVSQSTYQRIEKGKDNLWEYYSKELALIFKLTEEDFCSYLHNELKNTSSNNSTEYISKIEQLYEKIIFEKESKIKELESKINKLENR